MSSTPRLPDRTHPVAQFAARVHDVLDGLLDAPAWSMTPDEQRTSLLQLARAEARIAELRLRVLAGADRNDVADRTGASSTAAWLAHETRQDRPAAHADLRLALALDGGFTATRDALAGGRVDLAQARVIVRAVQQVPESVGQADRDRAEKHLVHLAADHDATA